MKPKQLIALALLIGGIAWFVFARVKADRHATYQGKHACAWALELYMNFNPEATNAASTALRALGTNAVPPLRTLLQVQEAFYEQPLFRNASSLPPSVRRYLFAKLKPGQSAIGRTGAAHALAVLGSEAKDALPELVAALQDPSAEVRWAAAQALGRIGAPAVPVLLTTLTNQDPSLRQLAIHSLGTAGTNAAPAAAQLFERVLEPNAAIPDAAVYALSRVGPTALPMILEQFASEDLARRAAAARVVRYMNTPPRQILRRLVGFCTNTAPDLRQHAFQSLASLRLDHPFAIATCVRGLDDPVPAVRIAAATALTSTRSWMTNASFAALTMRFLGQSGSLSNHVMNRLAEWPGDHDPALRMAAEQTANQIRAADQP
jgi:hypothetical protein